MSPLKHLLLSSLILLAACSRGADPEAGAAEAPVADFAVAERVTAPAAPTPMKVRGPVPGPAGSAAAGVVQRVIVRNASLTLVVENPEAELAPLGEIAVRFGGFVAQSGFSRDGAGLAAGNLQLRVDARRLDEVLEALRARAIEVRDFHLSSDDVTGEVVDVEARLRNLQAAERQLHDILRQARKTEDVMSVFGQLTQTRGEIEQSQARLHYLRESAALSSVQVSLIADAASRPLAVEGWQPTGTARRAVENLLKTLRALADGLIGLLIVPLPLLLAVFLPGWLLWRLRRRRQG